ncbi:MarR family winged helix-turn-helix transcriptional regulator [Curtobacterium sp. RHCJP20]|uniref:MarR family winged helix-turn-helix transcriptional regulator n=1 Tax=Curtobacterium subtropicum TaxID=3055138 RepID=A0ABT7TKJ2_9MICO|nr:MarR family winged helix-turn-helix transcriptional regulator [Curtobacterium subtropicum]MDM7889394.1 MarR family winged helix-turn-helix transcriptional regulator [Curtobacterium subtropicum]
MEPIETLADDLLTLHGRIRRTVLAGKADEVTASQTAALGRLLRHGESTVADLARAEGVRPQSMGATVQALVDLGLVERRPDPADGRRTLVRATETGSRARADAWTNRSRVLTDRLAALPEDDRATVARALAILLPLTDD